MVTTFDSGFSDWTPARLPDLAGKRYFITGANAGLGFEAAKMLRAKNADVLVGSRNEGKGRGAVSNIEAVPGSGVVEFVKIDLASKASIDEAATAVRSLASDGLDAIVNNAGVMQPPEQRTADGFEMQFGTNHLGHFYMNHALFDLVVARSGRIVPVSSIAHKPPAKLNFDNIMFEGNYSPTMAYGQSKLANIVYGFELHRRLETAGSEVSSISCHPGYSATNLQSTGPTGIWKAFYKLSNAVMAQPAERGAQPLVLSAAGVEARSGGYYGPVAFGGARGKISDSDVGGKIAMDPEAGRKLWELSEELLEISWTIYPAMPLTPESNQPEVLPYGDQPDQFVHLYRAAGVPRGTVISLHGGYWRAKYGLDLHEPIAKHLVGEGWTVINVEYRRVEPGGSPVWPEMSSDVLDACSLAADFDGPLIAMGHSAGGQLALWAAAQPSTSIDAVVALAPVSDLFLADGLELSNHATKDLLGDTAAERPDLYATASPLYLLPLGVPQLLVHGRSDDDVPYEMVPDYVEAATASGDQVTLVNPAKVDHMDVIDPGHNVWRTIDIWLSAQAAIN